MNFGQEFNNYPGQIPSDFDPKQFMKNMTDEQLLEIVKNNPELSKQYNNIIKNQLQGGHKPLTSQEYLQIISKIDQYLDPQGGLNIKPTEAFLLKSFEIQSNQKVFINIVTHHVVDQPEQKMLVDYQNQPGLRIPMSVGRVKQSHDNKGQICKVVDVVLNPRVTKQTQKDEKLLLFLFQILQNYLFQKYQIKLNQNFKKLKGRKYMGTNVQIHRVKGKKAPKIQQMSQQTTKTSQQQKTQQQLFESLNNSHTKTQQPKFTLFTSLDKKQIYDLQSTGLQNIIIEIQLPLLIHSKGILLQGNQDMIHLLVKGMYELFLRLPIKGTKFESRFIRNKRILQIQFSKLIQQIKQQQPIKNPSINNAKPISIQSNLLYDLV